MSLIVISGGHLFALQSLAWAKMAIEYSRSDSLQHALVKTFSGDYPCALCLKVQKSWQEKQKQDKELPSLTTEGISEAVCDSQPLSIPQAPAHLAPAGAFGADFFYSFSGTPPKPPPRA